MHDLKQMITDWEKSHPEIASTEFVDSSRNIWVGEHHYDEAFLEAELVLIQVVNPEFVLYEFLHGYIYDPQRGLYLREDPNQVIPSDLLSGPAQSRIKQRRRELINLADRIGFSLIGFDLGTNEYSNICKRKRRKFIESIDEENLRRLLSDGGWDLVHTEAGKFHGLASYHFNTPNGMIEAYDCLACPERHQEMGRVYNQFSTQSRRPIIVIAGAHHFGLGSELHENIKGKDYVIFYHPSYSHSFT